MLTRPPASIPSTLPAGAGVISFGSKSIPQFEKGDWQRGQFGNGVLHATTFALFVIAASLGRTLPPIWKPLIITPVVLVLVFLGFRVVAKWWYVQMALARLPESVDERARLRCVGLPSQIAAFGELVDQPFEPLVFRALTHSNLTLRMHIVAWGTGLAIGAVLTLLAFHINKTGNAIGIFLLAYLTGLAALSLFWPTYYRVSPGKVESLRFNVLGKCIAYQSDELRNARLLIDLQYRIASVDGRLLRFPFVLQPKLFAHYLFRAAITTHAGPPLPTDELLG